MEAARAAAQARKTRIDALNVDKDYRKMNAETGSKVVANIFDEIEPPKSDSSEVTCLKVAKTEEAKNSLQGLPDGVLANVIGHGLSAADYYCLSRVSKSFRGSDSVNAAKNSPESNYERGMKHYKEKDYNDAFPFLEKAATPKGEYKGHAEAQYSLGYMYQNGFGVEQDYAKAFELYQKAADQEYALAQYALGYMYYIGVGVTMDEAKAVKWFKKAAEQGVSEAQFRLGHMYRYCLGVDKDYAKAVEWFQKAAEQGNGNAQTDLYNLLAQHPELAQQQATASPTPPS